MTIFGKSRDLKTKTPKIQAACVFLQWNKNKPMTVFDSGPCDWLGPSSASASDSDNPDFTGS